MSDCIFCKLAAGEIPSRKAYEDADVLAFYDIAPAAPLHLVLIPKQHIPSCAALTEADGGLIGHLFSVIAKLADELGLKDGFRVVANTGAQGGQTVAHLHFHLLAGRDMTWPPG